MPLLLLLVGMFFPRVVIIVLYFFTAWFKQGFDGYLLPLLGFLFLPITLLWYGLVQHFFGGDWSGIAILGMVIALLLDFGLIGSSAKRRR